MTHPGATLPSLLELTFRGPGLKRLELTLPELTLPELTLPELSPHQHRLRALTWQREK
jgi:hypothetical protein